MSSLLALASLALVGTASALHAAPLGMHQRQRQITMMGGKKGTRGVPGNRGVINPLGGMTKKGKKKFETQDFEKDEWTLVAEKTDLGPDTGATKAVAAGQTPMGQEYVWTLIRGDAVKEGDDAPPTTVYATDGQCRTCQFPMTQCTVEPMPGGEYAAVCGLCGTKYSLETGKTLEFLPAKNPVQFAAKLANEKKGEQTCTILPTRVSRAGRCYVRLPDGTLPITRKRVDGTLNQFEEVTPKGR